MERSNAVQCRIVRIDVTGDWRAWLCRCVSGHSYVDLDEYVPTLMALVRLDSLIVSLRFRVYP